MDETVSGIPNRKMRPITLSSTALFFSKQPLNVDMDQLNRLHMSHSSTNPLEGTESFFSRRKIRGLVGDPKADQYEVGSLEGSAR
jgi:hypothetical protein